jgi:hypothetical protein
MIMAHRLEWTGTIGTAAAAAGLVVLWTRAMVAHRVARGALEHVLVRPVRDVLLVVATAAIAGVVVRRVERASEGEGEGEGES